MFLQGGVPIRVSLLPASAIIGFLAAAKPSASQQFGPLADCTLGTNCFVQQFADMDPGPRASDPFCGSATYDGHSGTDLRVLSMRDIESDIAVLSPEAGVVARVRDGEEDRLVRSEADRARIQGRDCGNGVVISHASGLETQLCHLRKGSLRVGAGDSVAKGQRIGSIGASGMAEFPHVHLTVRRDGKVVDPMTGHALDEGCDASSSLTGSLFAPDLAKAMHVQGPQLLSSGIAGGTVSTDALVQDGPPPLASTASRAVVAWAWLINLRAGDRLSLRLGAPDGSVVAQQDLPALERGKANYVVFAGRKRSPDAGTFVVETIVTGSEGRVLSDRREVVIR